MFAATTSTDSSPPSGTDSAAASRYVRLRRASPPDNATSWSIAASDAVIRPPMPRSSTSARRSTARTDASSSDSNFTISDRDNSGATTEKLGFSVVAATSNTTRFSTAANSASCWVLENLCTSSMNSTVDMPWIRSRRAWSMTARTSFTPEFSAERPTNFRAVACEMREAMVVLPVPGGP